MGVLIPVISEKNIWLDIGLIKFNTVHIIAITSIIVLTIVNVQGIKTGKYVQNSFTLVKTVILILFIILGLFVAKNTGAIDINKNIFWDASKIENGNIISLSGFTLLFAIGTAMVGSLFTSDAWNNITFAAGEVINPKRNIPLSLFIGTLIVTILYMLANVVYLQTLPLRGTAEGLTVFERGMQFATNDRLGTASMSNLFGEYAAILMAGFVVLSTFGCNNGLILSGARVYYAMSKDKLFFQKVGILNNKGVPAIALIFQCIWACLLCISGTYGQLLDYVVFAVLIFYVLTISGIFILRKKQPDVERPYKAFGYPVIPFIYIIVATLIMIDLLIFKPNYTWPGLIIVLMGIPIYFIWKKIEK